MITIDKLQIKIVIDDVDDDDTCNLENDNIRDTCNRDDDNVHEVAQDYDDDNMII